MLSYTRTQRILNPQPHPPTNCYERRKCQLSYNLLACFLHCLNLLFFWLIKKKKNFFFLFWWVINFIKYEKDRKEKKIKGTQQSAKRQQRKKSKQKWSISDKDMKVTTPEAFAHSNKVWRKKSFNSWIDLSSPSKVHVFLSSIWATLDNEGSYSKAT